MSTEEVKFVEVGRKEKKKPKVAMQGKDDAIPPKVKKCKLATQSPPVEEALGGDGEETNSVFKKIVPAVSSGGTSD